MRIFIVIAVFLLAGSAPLAAQTGSNEESRGSVPRSESFCCSQKHQAEADRLKPSEEELLSIKTVQDSLKERKARIKDLKLEIAKLNVTSGSSKQQIDDYNSKVNNYNSMTVALNSDATDLKMREDKWTAQSNAHHEYMQLNCHQIPPDAYACCADYFKDHPDQE